MVYKITIILKVTNSRYIIVLISYLSFLRQQVQNFGEPFFLVIHDGETLAEVKVRIQKKLQVPDEEFSKVHHIV